MHKNKGAFPELTLFSAETILTNNGEYLLLKIPFSKDVDFAIQAKTLKLYSRNGTAQVINDEIENSVLLLEGRNSGKSLHTLTDETEEVSIFTNIAKNSLEKSP